ncbi:multidrug effflux MFS transporter [Sphingomonas sp. BGYR3]|uniref:multidrug effflux MFS transporter n=1 Tax=Sphingomonas sp. BGYR3 TaxID=2975483 RepID=UPI0021A84CF6|nr:multidrug effflux MFS transporter [Sphingomonas sp. BGYR3]
MDSPARASLDRSPLPFAEFVALIAAIMALTALGIDSMLPALPAIGEALGVTEDNRRQFVITAFLLGFSLAQLVHGPLADRFGRKPVLVIAIALYVVTNIVAAFSASFTLLLIARFVSGMAVAAGRVVTIALVRDCFSGRAMARVMSMAFIVFMAAPVIAPAFGQFVLLFAPWRWIFGGIAIVASLVLTWFVVRMPETLAPADRIPLSIGRLAGSARIVLSDRCSVGYTLTAACVSGALFGFVGSVQQIVFDTFGRPELLVIVFASVAGLMAASSFLNSRIVMRFGMRVISHGALLAMIGFALIHLGIEAMGWETLGSFIVMQALTMGCFGLANTNFSAMAMDRMGQVAGVASSMQGFVSSLGGAVLGAVIGQSFDGTTVPLTLGFVLCGGVGLGIVLVTERGRLFRPQQA